MCIRDRLISMAIIVIPKMLAMFEPKIFPIAKLFCFLTIERIVAITSGNDVPKATIVIPIVVSATPNILVKFFAYTMKYLEL